MCVATVILKATIDATLIELVVIEGYHVQMWIRILGNNF